MSKLIIGIDVGGTYIKFGIFTVAGKLLYKWDIATRTEMSRSFIIDNLYQSLNNKIQQYDLNYEEILGIGVGIPGFIDGKKGFVYEAVNLGWKNVSFKSDLEEKTGRPVFIENDANIAALGENWQGAGEGSRHIIAVTLGTGLGGGIISHGKIINGSTGVGGELGHLQVVDNGVQCNCGQFGCLETVASATGIVRQALKAIETYPDSLLSETYKRKGKISSRDIFELAKQGEVHALNIIDQTAGILGKVFANLGVILNPEKILVGGGVSQSGSFLINKIVASFEENALERVKASCHIKQAKLGNDAGIYGCVFLVKQNMEGISF